MKYGVPKSRNYSLYSFLKNLIRQNARITPERTGMRCFFCQNEATTEAISYLSDSPFYFCYEHSAYGVTAINARRVSRLENTKAKTKTIRYCFCGKEAVVGVGAVATGFTYACLDHKRQLEDTIPVGPVCTIPVVCVVCGKKGDKSPCAKCRGEPIQAADSIRATAPTRLVYEEPVLTFKGNKIFILSGGTGNSTKILVDDKEVQGVTSCTIEIKAGEMVAVTMTTLDAS